MENKEGDKKKKEIGQFPKEKKKEEKGIGKFSGIEIDIFFSPPNESSLNIFRMQIPRFRKSRFQARNRSFFFF